MVVQEHPPFDCLGPCRCHLRRPLVLKQTELLGERNGVHLLQFQMDVNGP